jgi:ribosomal protein S5
MPQVARVRDQVEEPVTDPQRILGTRGHLHQVDVHVQDARVGAGIVAGQCPRVNQSCACAEDVVTSRA